MHYKKYINLIKKDIALLLILTILTPLIYLNLFKVPFVYDDFDFIFSWKQIHDFHHISSLLLGNNPIGHEGVYRPLRSIFYLINVHIFNNNLFLYHLQEITIYIICIILIYLITLKLFNNSLLSFLTSLVYLSLPIHVDNVANLTGNFDTIGIIFFFLSFFLFLQYLYKRNRILFLILSLLSSAISYFTYEITLILPFLIICTVFFLKKRGSYTIYICYFLIAIIYLSIRINILHVTNRGSLTINLSQKISSSIETASSSLITTMYPTLTQKPDISGGFLQFSKDKKTIPRPVSNKINYSLIPLTALLLILLISVKRFIGHHIDGYCLIWFYISLAPIIYITLQTNPITDKPFVLWGRYLIIASYGPCLLLGKWLLALFKIRPKTPILTYLHAFFLISIIAFIFINIKTVANNLDSWRDARHEMLIKIQKEKEDNAAKHNDLGVIYAMYHRYNESIIEFKAALAMDPKYSKPKQNLQKVCKIIYLLPHIDPNSNKQCSN